jgi:hypothetical protein
MTSNHIRYRLQTADKRCSTLAEWGPFLLALIVGAWLLFTIARGSPVFSAPAAEHTPRAQPQSDRSAVPPDVKPEKPTPATPS